MFRGHTGNDYPDRAILLQALLEDVDRIDSHGLLDLTEDVATLLRKAGYMTALRPGGWPVPLLPLEMLKPHPCLAGLARLWYGERALAAPPSPTYPTELKAANIAGLRFHDLRRTAASRWLESGVVPLHEISAWLGHTDIKTTSIYLRKAKRQSRRRPPTSAPTSGGASYSVN